WIRREGEQRLWLIEGQPDRWPEPGETVEQWLESRGGSFRGVAISRDAAARGMVFTDPFGSRPVFYRPRARRFWAGDKRSTLAAVSPSRAAPNWDALLEQLALGIVYGDDTTLAGARDLLPGERLEVTAGGDEKRARCLPPADARVRPEDAL